MSPASWTGSAGSGAGEAGVGALWLEETAAAAPFAEPCAVMGDPVRSPWPGPSPLCVFGAPLPGARGEDLELDRQKLPQGTGDEPPG